MVKIPQILIFYLDDLGQFTEEVSRGNAPLPTEREYEALISFYHIDVLVVRH